MRLWKVKVDGKSKYIPFRDLKNKHLSAICRRLIVKAQFQWVLYTFERILAGEEAEGTWWEYKHSLLEALLDEANGRGINLDKLEPTKKSEQRWLRSYLWDLAHTEIHEALAA